MVLWEDAIISFVVFANCITYSLLFIEQLFLLRMNIVEKAARAYTGDTEFIYRSIITRWDSFLRESGISFLLDFNRFPWKKRYTQERWTMTVDNDCWQWHGTTARMSRFHKYRWMNLPRWRKSGSAPWTYSMQLRTQIWRKRCAGKTRWWMSSEQWAVPSSEWVPKDAEK